jgi:energy-converting hydrogenase B subunit Q
MKLNIPETLKNRYLKLKEHSALEESPGFAADIIAEDRIGLMADIAVLVSAAGGNLLYIQSWIEHTGHTHIFIQVDKDSIKDEIYSAIKNVKSIIKVSIAPTYRKTYGKRVIIMGGGAQVAQVASGAITEADRHNIRGETISVDTIARIGEEELAQSVEAVGRLHRAAILVLAGSLMGGKIAKAVTALREEHGIPVIALNMAGSVTKAADLVVTDPVEAGVMAVMAISHVGTFNILKVHGRKY